MTVFYVGGLNELDKLPCRKTCDFRTDNCPVHEVVCDLPEEVWERKARLKQLKKRIRKELRNELR